MREERQAREGREGGGRHAACSGASPSGWRLTAALTVHLTAALLVRTHPFSSGGKAPDCRCAGAVSEMQQAAWQAAPDARPTPTPHRLLLQARCPSSRSSCIPWCVTRTGARCPSPWATSSVREGGLAGWLACWLAGGGTCWRQARFGGACGPAGGRADAHPLLVLPSLPTPKRTPSPHRPPSQTPPLLDPINVIEGITLDGLYQTLLGGNLDPKEVRARCWLY